MTNKSSLSWGSTVEGIPAEAVHVLVLEPNEQHRNELSAALRESGRIVTAYGLVSELESETTPPVVDFVIYSVGFGQAERPQEAWSVMDLLDAASIVASTDHVRVIYHEEDFIGHKEPRALVRDILRLDSFERDPWSALRSTPVVREKLEMAYRLKLFELGIALTIIFLALWGVYAPSITCLILVAVVSPFATAFSVNELIQLIDSYLSNRPSPPQEPEVEYVRTEVVGPARGAV